MGRGRCNPVQQIAGILSAHSAEYYSAECQPLSMKLGLLVAFEAEAVANAKEALALWFE